ncbi:MAG: hypothetical protein WBR10_01165 [Candidatus Acidiferrum sp.]
MQTTEMKSPDAISMLGRIFVAVALVVFGVQHFLYARFVGTLVPAWIPGGFFWANFVGAAFVAAALSIVTKIQARLAATLLGVMFLLFVVVVHTPRIAVHLKDSNGWTSGFVALGMTGCGFILAGAGRARNCPWSILGRCCFGLAMVAFGIQHLVYAKFNTGIGPPWVPGRPLLACLAGAVLIATAAGILIGRRAQVAAMLLGAALFFYSLLIYIPRLVAQPHNPGPWTSGFEILALAGSALVLSRLGRSDEGQT